MPGPFHAFWLLAEEEYRYDMFWDFVSRRDAPVRFGDDSLNYFRNSLTWVPTVNPAQAEMPAGHGLNWFGPTVVNRTGGDNFRNVCAAWAQLFAHGPEIIVLHERFVRKPRADDSSIRTTLSGTFEYHEVNRDWLVQTLHILEGFGEQAATGNYFILHLGI